MVAALITRPRGRNVYVLEADGKLVGTVSFRDLLRVTNARLGARRKGVPGFIGYLRDIFLEDVKKIMRKPVFVNPRTNLLEALQILEENKMNDMPIVDDDKKLMGELSGMEILRFAYADLKRGDEETAEIKEAERAKEE
jgi:CBS domain-containing protein